MQPPPGPRTVFRSEPGRTRTPGGRVSSLSDSHTHMPQFMKHFMTPAERASTSDEIINFTIIHQADPALAACEWFLCGRRGAVVYCFCLLFRATASREIWRRFLRAINMWWIFLCVWVLFGSWLCFVRQPDCNKWLEELAWAVLPFWSRYLDILQ